MGALLAANFKRTKTAAADEPLSDAEKNNSFSQKRAIELIMASAQKELGENAQKRLKKSLDSLMKKFSFACPDVAEIYKILQKDKREWLSFLDSIFDDFQHLGPDFENHDLYMAFRTITNFVDIQKACDEPSDEWIIFFFLLFAQYCKK